MVRELVVDLSIQNIHGWQIDVDAVLLEVQLLVHLGRPWWKGGDRPVGLLLYHELGGFVLVVCSVDHPFSHYALSLQVVVKQLAGGVDLVITLVSAII